MPEEICIAAKKGFYEGAASSLVGHLLKKYNIHPDKKLGQHFLADKNIIKKEVLLAGIAPTETVLEIGPGLGTLTRELLNKAKRVVAIEKDGKLAEILEAEIPDARLKIICADAIETGFPYFDRCVSNIPYEISSQVILKLGKCKKPALLILQKEFAERMAAKPAGKSYSRISVLSQYFFHTEILGTVSKHSFFPAPKVDSAIVRLTPRNDAEKRKFGVDDENFFFITVRALFQHKNQSARNAFIHSRHEFGLGKSEAKLVSAAIDHAERKVDALAIGELAEISAQIRGAIKK